MKDLIKKLKRSSYKQTRKLRKELVLNHLTDMLKSLTPREKLKILNELKEEARKKFPKIKFPDDE